jgi:hypothetical protein
VNLSGSLFCRLRCLLGSDERHLEGASGGLDRHYLEKWIHELDLTKQWGEAQRLQA